MIILLAVIRDYKYCYLPFLTHNNGHFEEGARYKALIKVMFSLNNARSIG